MATQAPESPLQDAVDAIRRRGLAAAARTYATDVKLRLRRGELGALPVVLAIVLIWIFFRIEAGPAFLSARNLTNLVLQIAVVGTIAVGIVLVLLLGEIDLSVGSVAGLTSAVLGVLMVHQGWPWWSAILAVLLVGAAIGAFQGAWFSIIGIPSFVVTLAGLLGWFGVQMRVLGQEGTINVFDERIAWFTTTFLPENLAWALAIAVSVLYALSRLLEQAQRRRAQLPAQPVAVVAVRTLGLAALALGTVYVLNYGVPVLGPAEEQVGDVPTAGLILLGIVIFFAWVTTGTRFGRHIYAVGGNAEAARRAGINVTRIRIAVFTLCGTLTAVGGLLAVSRLGAASTQTGGGTLLLEVIAAAVIGGTSLFGGRGTVWAALLGAIVLGSVSNGLDLMGQPADVKFIVQGSILLLAVTVDALSRRAGAASGR
jgi:D-xylose transport system permease protein